MRRPLDQHIHVSVPADAGELLDLRIDADALAKEFDLLRAFHQGAAERTRRLESHEENRVCGVPKPVLEVVLDSARLAHTARGKDHLRACVGIDRHRLLARFRDRQPLKREGVDALLDKCARFVVITEIRVLQIDARGGVCQRAIDKHGEVFMSAHELFFLDVADEVQKLLCAPDGERRHDDAAAAVKGGLQHVRQRSSVVRRRVVHPVAIGGFDHDIVRLVDKRRIAQ